MLFPIYTLSILLAIVNALPARRSSLVDDSGPYLFMRENTNVTAKDTTTPKLVIAHHMVGNTYPYTVDTWTSDISLAHASGIDGFALNIGSDSWQPDQVANAYQAAESSGTGFKLFVSFDMSQLACSTADNASALRNYITTYASHPNQLLYGGKVFASTFSGESCTFGQSSVAQGWSTQFYNMLTGANAIYFVPSFFVDPSTFSTYNGLMDGALNWNSGWPISLATSVATPSTAAGQSTIKSYIGSTTTDTQYISGLSSMENSATTHRAYMAAVSPWFFTHYSPQTYNKNFIYDGDDHLYPTRWQNLIGMRDQIDLIEIATWNDYGESHYIGPIEGAQPNSQAWVDGMDHTGWLDMTSYFATAFKTGSYPAITKDKIYLWARTHPTNAVASSDSVGQPTNYQLFEDELWAVVMTTAPSNVTLTTGSAAADSTTTSVPAGLTKLSMPLTPGGFMEGAIVRNGDTVASLKPSGYTFNPSPTTYNFNAFVAYTT